MNLDQQLHTHNALIVQVAKVRASYNTYDADEIAQRARMIFAKNYEKYKKEDGCIDVPLVRFFVNRAALQYFERDKVQRRKTGLPTDFDAIKEAAGATNADDLIPVSTELTLVDTLRELTLSDSKCKPLTTAVFNALYNDPFRSDVDIARELDVADTTIARHRRKLREISYRKLSTLVS